MDSKSLAFIIDGQVVSVSRFDSHTASILLSSPIIIDVTPISISEDWQYDESTGFYTTIDGNEVVLGPESLQN